MDEQLLKQCMEVAQSWATDEVFDEDTRNAVKKMMENRLIME